MPCEEDHDGRFHLTTQDKPFLSWFKDYSKTFKTKHIYIGIYCRSKNFDLQFAYSFKGNGCVKVIKDLKIKNDYFD